MAAVFVPLLDNETRAPDAIAGKTVSSVGGTKGSGAPLVLVTGATGFLGSWIVQTLLHSGYCVRGTARSLKDEKVGFLRALPFASERLELVTADLLDGASVWDLIVRGADFVLHVASPFFLGDDEDKLIKPAVNGTRSVLLAARKARSVKRVVLTASTATVMYGHGDLNAKRWGPGDFSDPDGPDIDVYAKSKTLAEREAWAIARGDQGEHAALGGPAPYTLTTMHPGFITGPVLAKQGTFQSMQVMQRIMSGASLIHAGFNSIDVRDAALAHVLALTAPKAPGKRLILSHSAVPIAAIQDRLSRRFNPFGFNVSTSQISTWVLVLASCVSREAARAAARAGKYPQLDASETLDILGMRFSDQLSSYEDMALAAIAHGYIDDPSEGGALSGPVAGLAVPFVPPLARGRLPTEAAAGGAASQSAAHSI